MERWGAPKNGRWSPVPLPTQRGFPYVGVGLILLPSLVMLPFNPALSFFLILGAIIYVGVYTIWLKPRTLLNIVIGGAAGSAAVLSGSAAVGNWNDPGALVLSLLLFLWTPFHFWSLALLYRDDYARSDVPMLPVHTTPRQAAWWVMSPHPPSRIRWLAVRATPRPWLALHRPRSVGHNRFILAQY